MTDPTNFDREMFRISINDGKSMIKYYTKSNIKPHTNIIWSILAQVSDALYYLHSKKIIHRDIKPENLLFAARDTSLSIIKVSDFGLARFIDNETLATTTCGTPGYVAPEILEQRPYRDACDFWSVGVVLFILLSGTPPFYDEDNFALFEKIKRCDYNFNAPSW